MDGTSFEPSCHEHLMESRGPKCWITLECLADEGKKRVDLSLALCASLRHSCAFECAHYGVAMNTQLLNDRPDFPMLRVIQASDPGDGLGIEHDSVLSAHAHQSSPGFARR